MRRLLLPVLVLGGLALPASAPAAVHHAVYFSDPIKAYPYEAEQAYMSLKADGRHAPGTPGWITAIDTDVVARPSAAARSLPIQDVMIHHLVLHNPALDAPLSCGGRFYARGEEHERFTFPKGYGIPNRSRNGLRAPRWMLTHMLMNHRSTARTAYVRMRVTWTDEPQKDLDPLFLDTKNCAVDPIYDIPGGGRKGSTVRDRELIRVPKDYSGRIIMAGGHLHGGGKYVRLGDLTCRRRLVDSRAYYGMPNDPFYKVRPRLHEASPIRIGIVRSAQGIPVAGGDLLALDAGYDGSRLHTRVMNILLGYLARGPVRGCPAMPNDVKVVNRPRRYRAAPPPYAVPILHPPKTPFRRTRTTKVDDEGFWPHRISVPSGKALTWNFRASMLHSVTVTAGPRGFSSPWTSNGSFSFTPRRKGTYQIFCSLHPSQMVQVVKVR